MKNIDYFILIIIAILSIFSLGFNANKVQTKEYNCYHLKGYEIVVHNDENEVFHYKNTYCPDLDYKLFHAGDEE